MLEKGKKVNKVKSGCGKCLCVLFTVSLIVAIIGGVGYYYRDDILGEIKKHRSDDVAPSTTEESIPEVTTEENDDGFTTIDIDETTSKRFGSPPVVFPGSTNNSPAESEINSNESDEDTTFQPEDRTQPRFLINEDSSEETATFAGSGDGKSETKTKGPKVTDDEDYDAYDEGSGADSV